MTSTISKDKICLIDADSISYVVSYNSQHIPIDQPDLVAKSTNEYVEKILDASGCNKYIGFVGNKGYTFRHLATISELFGQGQGDKLYKGNRGPQRPSWYQYHGGVIKAQLFHKWGFNLVPPFLEADDAVSILAHELRAAGLDYVIASPDKDLKQIGGNFFDYKSMKHEFVDQDTAEYLKYKQVLMGDTTDNIVGIPKCGPKTADKILSKAKSPAAYKHLVLEAYINHYGERTGVLKFAENVNLIFLLDNREQIPLNIRQDFTANVITRNVVDDKVFN